MEKLEKADTILVQQKKEWGEILTGFETKNRYSIRDRQGEELYLAAEGSSLLSRLFLKSMRPLVIHILSPEGQEVLTFHKPFRFYFHQIDVVENNGRKLGWIKREFSIFAREFTVMDSTGVEIFRIHGPFFHPWTFHLNKNGTKLGEISKKWSGLGKEFLTDADNFSIEFPASTEMDNKCLLLGALFLIDLLHFERK